MKSSRLSLAVAAAFLFAPSLGFAQIHAMVNYETKSPESMKVLKNPVSPGARKEGIAVIDVVFHREREIVLSMEDAGDQSDRASRHELANKDHTTSPSVGRFFSDIKSQVYFFEIAMERNRETKQPSVQK